MAKHIVTLMLGETKSTSVLYTDPSGKWFSEGKGVYLAKQALAWAGCPTPPKQISIVLECEKEGAQQ